MKKLILFVFILIGLTEIKSQIPYSSSPDDSYLSGFNKKIKGD